jgi:SAM-dependent methyltransferase
MREKFIDMVACPDDACRSDLRFAEVAERHPGREDDIIAGALECIGCGKRYPIEKGIARFVDRSLYRDTWSWLWKRFYHVRGQTRDGTDWIREAVLERPRWTPDFLKDKSLMEFGCGSGNDTEVLADVVKTLISLELSDAVDVIPEHLLARDNVLVLQADLLHVPVKRDLVDLGFCHRVIMHTPDPEASFRSMAPHVKPGGEFFLHSYDTHLRSMLQFKYIYRPITKRLSTKTVYRILSVIGPVLYPLVGLLRRVGLFRKPVKLLIPFCNYSRELVRDGSKLNARDRYEWNMLLTLDALTPMYDNPNSPETMQRWFEQSGYEQIELLGRNPVIMKARRAPQALPHSVPAQAVAG